MCARARVWGQEGVDTRGESGREAFPPPSPPPSVAFGQLTGWNERQGAGAFLSDCGCGAPGWAPLPRLGSRASPPPPAARPRGHVPSGMRGLPPPPNPRANPRPEDAPPGAGPGKLPRGRERGGPGGRCREGPPPAPGGRCSPPHPPPPAPRLGPHTPPLPGPRRAAGSRPHARRAAAQPAPPVRLPGSWGADKDWVRHSPLPEETASLGQL